MTIAIVLLAGLLLYVLWDRSKERREWTAERRLLLTRIQAPETVPVELPDDAPLPVAVQLDNDEDYWAAQRLRNGSS